MGSIWDGQLLECCASIWTSQVAAVVKNLPASAGDSRDSGSIPVSGRYPGGRNGNPLQYSCLKSSMDWGAWRATAHGVTKRQTRLSASTLTLVYAVAEEVLFLWRHLLKYLVVNIGPQRAAHDWSDLACKQNVITSAPCILKKEQKPMYPELRKGAKS